MSDSWDVYLKRVNDNLASILLDMGIRDQVPDERRPCLLYVWVRLENPNGHGLPEGSEFDALNQIDDALQKALLPKLNAIPVACVSTACRREFYYYAPADEGLDEVVNSVFESFPAREWMCNSVMDAEWEHYLDVLYPNPIDRRQMDNGKVVRALHNSGDTLEKERMVSHWAYFSTAAARSAFVHDVEAQNFVVKDQSEDADKPDGFGVCFERVDHVDWNSINEVTLELLNLATSHEGTYDGWETVVVNEDPSA